MTPQQIEYVLAVAEERSFSKAAKKLFVTQPSLSKFIINLESSLGVPLFDRSSSPITITEAGKIFIETANQMKDLEVEMALKMGDLIGMKNGKIKIGTSPFYAANMLLKSVISFHKKYPEIQIEIREDNSTNLEEAILRGELDLMIGTAGVDEDLFNVEELCMEKIYLAVPRESSVNKKCAEYALEAEDILSNSEKLFSAENINLNMFRKEKFIFQSEGEYASSVIRKLCRKYSFSPQVTFRTNNLDTIFLLLSEGMGAAFIPDSYIKFADISSHPVYYAINDEETEKHIKLIYKKNKYLSRASVAFSSTLRELIGMGTWK